MKESTNVVWGWKMDEREEKVIEKVFDDAMERAWEEAKLRDLMTLYHMWESGEFGQFKNFDELFKRFCAYDDRVRHLDEKSYFNMERLVVETICSSEEGINFGICHEEVSEE